jgi:hypothetical protein
MDQSALRTFFLSFSAHQQWGTVGKPTENVGLYISAPGLPDSRSQKRDLLNLIGSKNFLEFLEIFGFLDILEVLWFLGFLGILEIHGFPDFLGLLGFLALLFSSP